MGDFQTYVQQNFTYSVILLFIGAFFGFGFDAIKLAYHQKKLRKAFCILLEEDLNYLLDNLYSKNFQTKFWDEHKVEIAKVRCQIWSMDNICKSFTKNYCRN